MAKKGGFFGSFFEKVEEDPIEKAKKAQKKTVAEKPAEVPSSAASSSPGITLGTLVPIATSTSFIGSPASTSGYTGKFDNVMESIVDKENLPGPDVYELITSVNEMLANGMAEDMAYRSVFTAFKSVGLTKDKLIETSQHYLSVVQRVYDDFIKNVIDKKQERLTAIGNRRVEIMQEIEALNEEARVLATQHSELEQEVSSNKQEIDGSYAKTKSYFESVILKIQSYLN